MVVYLDYAASAPLRPEAARAWLGAEVPGNPSSLHGAGRSARATVDAAREAIAAAFGASSTDVVFTSGGTEADALGLAGIFHARQSDAARPGVVISAVEHHAIGETARLLAARHGARVTRLPVGRDGVACVDALAATMDREGEAVAVISVMGANNETGAIQPVPEIVALAAARGIPVHCDLVHAAGKVPIGFGASGLAAASISAHKLGGPVGIGALLVRRGTPLAAIGGGGGQERGVRSGTVDARGAAGFAAAAQAAQDDAGARLEELLVPLDRLVAQSGGSLIARTPPAHVPGTRLITAPGTSSEVLTYLLDREGIAVSAGSACTAGVVEASPVLEAMGLGPDETRAGLRISVGWASTAADIEALVAVLPDVVALARRAAADTRHGQSQPGQVTPR